MEKKLRSSLTSCSLIAKLSLHRPLSYKGSKNFSLEGTGVARGWRLLAASCLCVPQGDHLCRRSCCQPQTAHPPTLLGCQGTHWAQGDCRVAWRGETRPFPLVLSLPGSLSSLCPPAGVCCPRLMPTISLEAGLPQFSPLTCACRSSGSEGDLEVFQLGLYVPRGWEDWCEPPTPELLIWLQITGQTLSIS